MRWATRAGVHIDRAACAWLLRRFIDPEASFVFVDDPAEVPAEATAFDMRGVELGHHGGDCSFETIRRCGSWLSWSMRPIWTTSALTPPRPVGWTWCSAVSRWSVMTGGCWRCR